MPLPGRFAKHDSFLAQAALVSPDQNLRPVASPTRPWKWRTNCFRRGKPQFFFCLFAADGQRLIGPWNRGQANAAEYSKLRDQMQPPPRAKKEDKSKVGQDTTTAICACAHIPNA